MPEFTAGRLETLRGPNTTFNLARAIKDSLPFSADGRAFDFSSKPTILEHAVAGLQEWARGIDRPIVREAALRDLTDRASLDKMVADLIRQGAISPKMDLFALFQYHGRNRIARQDQWNMVRVLFGINTSALAPGHTGGMMLPDIHRLDEVHGYMFDLIRRAASGRIVGAHELRLKDEYSFQNVPTTIEGVRANLIAANFGFMNAWGMPHIVGLALDLDVSFIASVRPLSRENLSEIFPPKEEQTRSTDSGSSSSNRRYYQDRERDGEPDNRDPHGYYRTLGVNPDTAPEDMEEVLSAAFRRLSKKYHPDTGGDPERMKKINVAYEALKKAWGEQQQA